LIREGSARKRGQISKQSFEVFLTFGFPQFHFAFSCASFYFHTGPLIRLQRMSFERLDGERGFSPLVQVIYGFY